MTFEEASQLTRSEKITLVTCQAEHLIKLFTVHAGAVYKREVDHFVESVKSFGVELEEVDELADVVEGSYYYDILTRTIYLHIEDDADPKVSDISAVYKFFFSNAPLNLPCDLSTGETVEWLPLINSIGSIGQQLDELSTGIVLESSSTIDLINNHGFFDGIYDKFIWENKPVLFYTWFSGTSITEARKIFEGVIESKDYAPDKVTFKVKDFVYRLRDLVRLETFSEADGTLPDSLLATPKRRVYGQVKQMAMAGIDNVLDGFDLAGTLTVSADRNLITGTVQGTATSTTITGIGTSFIGNLAPGNEILITDGAINYSYNVATITSDTTLTITSPIITGFTGAAIRNLATGATSIVGTGAITSGGTTLTGTSTTFLTSLRVGSKIRIESGGNDYDNEVAAIASNTSLTLSNTSPVTVTGASLKLVSIKNNIIEGVGTQFFKELTPGDEVSFEVLGVIHKFGIEEIISDTEAVINKATETNIQNQTAKNKPSHPYRYLNRTWHVAGHKLREPTATITEVKSNNRFIVDTTIDMFAGDQVLINGDLVTIRRISGNEIVTQNAVSPTPSVSDEMVKLPIQKVFFGDRELIYGRDWDYANTTEAIVTIDELAEFNITQERLAGASLTFTNGSEELTTSTTLDFRTILSPRDWIKKNSIVSGEGDWYEILDVKEQSITLRIPYTGTTATTTALIKQVKYIEDDSIMTCNCLGMQLEGAWIKTPSDTVRHLVLNDANFGQVDEASFAKARAGCDYIVSLVVPESLGGNAPSIRDTITKINESCFGSLYGNGSLFISYSILNSDKPEVANVIKDDDVLSWDTQTRTEIYNEVVVNYRPFVDLQTGSDTFEVTTYNSGFVDKYIGIRNTLTKTLYLYESDKAEIIAQRLALFYSMASTSVTIKGKMNFFLNAVNDRLFISMDRLFRRFGANDRRKLGIITSIKKSQTEVEVQISDLGNIFNRVPSIAPDASPAWASASDDDKVRFGYVVDNDTFTPDVSSEDGTSCNLIG